MKSNKALLIFIISIFTLFLTSCDIIIDLLLQAKYKVNHYTENVDDSDYTLEETETLKGIPGLQTEAVAKEYEGFTVKDDWEQADILYDGTTEINIYYTRNTYTIKYYSDGTIFETKTFKYEKQIKNSPVPTKEGYIFKGWYPELPAYMPAENLKVAAKWVAENGDTEEPEIPEIPIDPEDPDTPEDPKEPEIPEVIPEGSARYIVRHCRAGNDTVYEEKKIGKIGEMTQANFKNYEGYFVAAGWKQATIKENNTTVVTINYNKKKYYINIDLDGGALEDRDYWDSTFEKNFCYEYGEVVDDGKFTQKFVSLKKGYSFVEYDPPFPKTMPAHDITIKAIFRKDPTYIAPETETKSMLRFNYYYELLTPINDRIYDNYSETHFEEGIVGTVSTHTPVVSEGFYIDYNKRDYLAGKFEELSSAYMCSKYINIYFLRKTSNIIFDTDGGSAVDTITGKYGADVSSPKDPVKQGYVFKGWSVDLPSTMPANDLVVKALWKEATTNGGEMEGIIY